VWHVNAVALPARAVTSAVVTDYEIRVRPARVEAGRVRLSAEVGVPGAQVEELWYELDEAHRAAVVDRADPFVVAALVLAMREQRTMRVVGAPVSSSLVRNLEEFQIVWSSWYGFPIVEIVADEQDDIAWSGPAATAFTGGVDSAFSAYWHTRGGRRLDRPLEAGMMVHGVDIPRGDVVGFQRAAERSRRMLDSVGLELITVETNAWDPQPRDARYVAIGVASALHLLGGRFSTGLIPSTVDYGNLVIPISSNPVSDPLLGGRSMTVVHDGAGFGRLEKVRMLAGWGDALESLRVCLRDPRHDRNCGECPKCMLTLLEFHVLGVEPTCFDRLPSDDEFAAWASALPNHGLHRNEARAILEEADARGLHASWIAPLRRKLLVIRSKNAVRQVAPHFSEQFADAHRWAHQQWQHYGPGR
jgi:hypothetical protein